jgi:hypothetical protein
MSSRKPTDYNFAGNRNTNTLTGASIEDDIRRAKKTKQGEIARMVSPISSAIYLTAAHIDFPDHSGLPFEKKVYVGIYTGVKLFLTGNYNVAISTAVWKLEYLDNSSVWTELTRIERDALTGAMIVGYQDGTGNDYFTDIIALPSGAFLVGDMLKIRITTSGNALGATNILALFLG